MIDPKSLLVVTVGLPRSGKSTWAVKMSAEQGYPIVNPDSIRKAIHGQSFYGPAEPMVWGIAQTMVRSLYLAGHHGVIVDATNTTENRRQMWRMMGVNLIWVVLTTPVESCVARAKAENNNELVDVISRMSASMQGFKKRDRIVFIDLIGERMKQEPGGWRIVE